MIWGYPYFRKPPIHRNSKLFDLSGSYYTVETLVLYSKFWDKATSQQ